MLDDEVVLVVPVLHPKVRFSTYQAENLKHLVMLSQESSYQRADGFCVLVIFYRRKEMLLFKFAFGFQTFKQFFFYFLLFLISESLPQSGTQENKNQLG